MKSLVFAASVLVFSIKSFASGCLPGNGWTMYICNPIAASSVQSVTESLCGGRNLDSVKVTLSSNGKLHTEVYDVSPSSNKPYSDLVYIYPLYTYDPVVMLDIDKDGVSKTSGFLSLNSSNGEKILAKLTCNRVRIRE